MNKNKIKNILFTLLFSIGTILGFSSNSKVKTVYADGVEVPKNYISDSNKEIAYFKYAADNHVDVMGFVDGKWRSTTSGDRGFQPHGYPLYTTFPENEAKVKISFSDAKIINNGSAVEITYQIEVLEDVDEFRFYVEANIAVNGNTYPINNKSGNAAIFIDKNEDVSMYVFPTDTNAIAVPGKYKRDIPDLDKYYGSYEISQEQLDPIEFDEYLKDLENDYQPSALYINYPLESLTAGQVNTYSFVVGMNTTDNIFDALTSTRQDLLNVAETCCPECQGTGVCKYECPDCGGTGCTSCLDGFIIDDCRTCKGSGTAKYTSLSSTIENVLDGETITLLKDNSETITVSKDISFTIDSNNYSFSSEKISAGTGYMIECNDLDNGKYQYRIGVPKVKIGDENFFTLQKAVSSYDSSHIITLLADNSETFTVAKSISFTIKFGDYEFDPSKIVAGENFRRTYNTINDQTTFTFVELFDITNATTDQNGTVTLSETSKFEGGTVYVTVTPNSGYKYKADSLKVTYNDGEEDQTCTIYGSDGSYFFEMPAFPVSVSAEFEEKATISINETAQDAETYDKSGHTYTITGTDSALTGFNIKYYVDDSWTETAPVNVGKYNVKITRDEDDNYKAYSKEISEAITIEKLALAYPQLSSKKYTGETLTADVAESDFYTVVENNGGINKGEYKIKIELTDPDNTRWYSSDKTQVTLSWFITQATNSWKSGPAIYPKTYDGAPAILYSTATFEDIINDTYEYFLFNVVTKKYEKIDSTPSAAGKYQYKITIAATANYTGLTFSNYFTISPKTITVNGIKANNKSYDGTNQATFSYDDCIFDGRVGTDDIGVSAVGTFENETIGDNKVVNISSITISNTNYVLADSGNQTTATANIEATSIIDATVTFTSDLTYTGGEQTISISSVKLGDLTLDPATDYDIQTNTNTGTNAGTYTLTITGKGIFKDSANISWTIAKAPLTVTANAETINYNEDPANNGVSYEGFVNNETKDILSGSLTFTYNYSKGDNAGEYSITPAGLTATNYDINFVDGKLTVNKIQQNIIVEDVDKFYNGISVSIGYTKLGDGTAKVEFKKATESDDKYTTTAPINAGNYVARISVTEGTNYLADTVTKQFIIDKSVIKNIGVNDIDQPVALETAVTDAAIGFIGGRYTATVSYSPTLNDGKFNFDTIYTATLTIEITSANTGNYKFDDTSAIKLKGLTTTNGWEKVGSATETKLVYTKTFLTTNSCVHSLTKIEGLEPTKENDGFKEAWKCSICGNYYADEAGNNLIGDEEAYNAWILNEGKLPQLHNNNLGLIIVICLLFLLIIYLFGYFFLYRQGKLDDSGIKVIYKILPRGNKNLPDEDVKEDSKKKE